MDIIHYQEDEGHFGGAAEQTEALMLKLEQSFGDEIYKAGGSTSLNKHSNINLSVFNDTSAVIASSYEVKNLFCLLLLGHFVPFLAPGEGARMGSDKSTPG